MIDMSKCRCVRWHDCRSISFNIILFSERQFYLHDKHILLQKNQHRVVTITLSRSPQSYS